MQRLGLCSLIEKMSKLDYMFCNAESEISFNNHMIILLLGPLPVAFEKEWFRLGAETFSVQQCLVGS
jgi:hypothetical protein